MPRYNNSKVKMSFKEGRLATDENVCFDFGVKRERLYTKNGRDTEMDCLIRTDTGNPISVVSPRYHVTTHKQANDFVMKMLAKFDVNYEIGQSWVDNKGAKFFREIKLPDYEFIPSEDSGIENTALEGGSKNDSFIPTFIMKNSFDRTTAFQLLYGGIRMVCTNGILVGDVVQNIIVKHNRDVDFEKLEPIFMSNIEKTVDGIKRIYNKLNTTDGNPILEMLIMEILSKKMLQAFLYQLPMNSVSIDFDKDTGKPTDLAINEKFSAYLIYQIMTAVITHKVKQMNTRLAWSKKVNKVFGV